MTGAPSATLAVVIGFRDWGLDRLAVALRSHAASTIKNVLDIVVVDYGSADAAAVRSTVEACGARCVRVEVVGPWSRARALNAGLIGSSAPYALTTDADIIFAPRSHEIIIDYLRQRPDALHLIQCRDLNADYRAETLIEFDWTSYRDHSSLRPRWGMGGMAAFSRSTFDLIRGYDDRMEIYGGEDNDFALRMRRSGAPLSWIADTEAEIYHIWHPATRAAIQQDSAAKSSLDANADIVKSDKTWVRNISAPSIQASSRPLATVAICTFNRSDYLRECLASTLMQQEDIEVLIVDDGSTDDTRAAIEEFSDPRVRCIVQDHQGVSVARNRTVHEARADFIVVQDDDDIMLPNRIAHHFAALREGMHGSYGGWIDFDNSTGRLTPHQGREFGFAAALCASRVLSHGVSMFSRAVLHKFPYNNSLRAGTDYDLILRMARCGIKMSHTGAFHILRRFHEGNLTLTIPEHQRASAQKVTNLMRKNITSVQYAAVRETARQAKIVPCQNTDTLERHFAPYLPDALIHRFVHSPASGDTPISEALGFATRSDDAQTSRAIEDDSVEVTYREFLDLARANPDIDVRARRRHDGGEYRQWSLSPNVAVMMIVERAPQTINLDGPAWRAVRSAGSLKREDGPKGGFYVIEFSSEGDAIDGIEHLISDGIQTSEIVLVTPAAV